MGPQIRMWLPIGGGRDGTERYTGGASGMLAMFCFIRVLVMWMCSCCDNSSNVHLCTPALLCVLYFNANISLKKKNRHPNSSKMPTSLKTKEAGE